MSNYIEQGKSFLEKKEYTKALEFFQAAIESMESPKDAHLGLAETYFAIGKFEKGKVSLFQAMALDPNNPQGLSMIQTYCLSEEKTILPPNQAISIGLQTKDVVVSIKQSHLGENHWVAEQKSGNTIFFRVESTGCIIEAPDNIGEWDGYRKPTGILEIPSEFIINGKQVKVHAIDENAFGGNKYIKDVILPEHLQIVGGFNCTKVSNLIFSNNLQIISPFAFNGTSIKQFHAPLSLTSIGRWAFSYCENLSDVSLNEGLAKINDYAFKGCPIQEINIPSSVIYIGENVFPDNTTIRLIGKPPKIKAANCHYSRIYIPEEYQNLYEKKSPWYKMELITY